MSFRLKVTKETLPGKGPGIYIAGPYVTPAVHDAISRVMHSNYFHDEAYKARMEVSAFFQGGCHDRNGEFIFLELWVTHNPEAVQRFEDVINRYVGNLIPEAFTEIRIAANTEGVYYYFTEIAKETGCRYDAGSFNTPMYFYPEDNEQWWKVYNLCKQMGLTIGFPQF